jgi:hypothetical protein
MTDSLPLWADPELSSRLVSLVAEGEGHRLEFKSEYGPELITTEVPEPASAMLLGAGLVILRVSHRRHAVGSQ